MSHFRSEATTIGSLLTHHSFEIPAFQRPYEWGRRQIAALLADLFGQGELHDFKSSYFLGAIVLEERADGGHRIVDGQQRLVTMSLLAGWLAQHLEDPDPVRSVLLRDGSPVLRLLNQDREVFGALLERPSRWSEARWKNHRVAAAVGLIEEFLDERLGPEKGRQYLLTRMAYRCLNHCEVVRITASRGSDAYQVFETLNERGLELSQADLIKNKLLWSAPPDKVEDIARLWRECEELVGDQMNRFLRHFWSAFVEQVSSKTLYDAIRRWLDQHGEAGVEGLVTSLRVSAEHYRVLLDPRSHTHLCPERARSAIAFLNSLGARNCWPLMLLCWRLYPQELSWLAGLCEVVTVRARLVTQSATSSTLEEAYSRCCRQIRERLNLSLQTVEQQGGITAIVEVNQAVLSQLDPLVPDDSVFIKACRELAPSRLDRRWKAFLGRLMPVPGEEGDWLVDHVLPRSLPGEALKEGGLTRRQATRVVDSLGNLCLINRALGPVRKAPLSQKRHLYESAGHADLAEAERWGTDSIRDRCQRLAERAVETWPPLRRLGLF